MFFFSLFLPFVAVTGFDVTLPQCLQELTLVVVLVNTVLVMHLRSHIFGDSRATKTTFGASVWYQGSNSDSLARQVCLFVLLLFTPETKMLLKHYENIYYWEVIMTSVFSNILQASGNSADILENSLEIVRTLKMFIVLLHILSSNILEPQNIYLLRCII